MKPVTAGIVFSMLLGSTPFLAHAAQQDIDNDQVPNTIDPDVDGDGIPNQYEQFNQGLRYRVAIDGGRDNDGDGWSNAEEYRRVTRFDDPNSNPSMRPGYDMQKIFGFDAATKSWFGESVDIEGDWAVIGAPGAPTHNDLNGSRIDPYMSGGAYVYHRNNGEWQLHTRLTPLLTDDAGLTTELPEFSGFGRNVALTMVDGHDYPTVAVSATGIDSVFVFKADAGNWQQSGMIEGPVDDDFGVSLDVDGSTLVVGAPKTVKSDEYFDSFSSFGSVFVYDVHGPADIAEPQMITEIRHCENDLYCEFGTDLDLDGDTLAVTSPVELYERAASVFTRVDGVWELQANLVSTLSDGEEWTGVALSGDRILLTEYNDADFSTFTETGDIVEFTRNGDTWSETNVIFAEDLGVYALGSAIALDGDIALTRDSDGNVIGLYRGADSWIELSREQVAPEDIELQHFLDIDEATGTVLVGAPEDLDGGDDAGAAYFVDLTSIQ